MQREYRHAYLSFHGKDTVQVEVNRERLRLFVPGPLLVVTAVVAIYEHTQHRHIHQYAVHDSYLLIHNESYA